MFKLLLLLLLPVASAAVCGQQQDSQALQLRLTITAADRALLRDKLSDAEQQLASYQNIIQEYEAEREELFDTARGLFDKVEQLTELNLSAAAEINQLRAANAAGLAHSSIMDISRTASSPALTVPVGSRASCINEQPSLSCSSCHHDQQQQQLVPQLSIGGSRFSKMPSLTTPREQGQPAAAASSPAAASAGVAGNCPIPGRPKSALAALGASKPSSIPTACTSAGNSPRTHINAPERLNSSPMAAAVSGAYPKPAPHQPLPTNSINDIGVNNLNPICISSPFAYRPDEAAAVASRVQTSSGPPQRSVATPGNSNSSSTTSSRVNTGLLTGKALAALTTGASRIPLPPCLQQRPARVADFGSTEGSGSGSCKIFRIASFKSSNIVVKNEYSSATLGNE